MFPLSKGLPEGPGGSGLKDRGDGGGWRRLEGPRDVRATCGPHDEDGTRKEEPHGSWTLRDGSYRSTEGSEGYPEMSLREIGTCSRRDWRDVFCRRGEVAYGQRRSDDSKGWIANRGT